MKHTTDISIEHVVVSGSDATTYVLNPENGYQVAQTGANGFSCIVQRTEWERADFRNDVYAARSMVQLLSQILASPALPTCCLQSCAVSQIRGFRLSIFGRTANQKGLPDNYLDATFTVFGSQ